MVFKKILTKIKICDKIIPIAKREESNTMNRYVADVSTYTMGLLVLNTELGFMM